MPIYIGNNKTKLYIGNSKVKKAYIGATQVYSSGNTVTYYTNSNESYTEEFDEGVSVLSPTSFTPTLSGYTFVGWRTDKTANSSVLTSLKMGDEPITLYAVYKRKFTLTLYNGSSTPTITSHYEYCNPAGNNNVYPTVTLLQNGKSDWVNRGWSKSTAANESISYGNAQTITLNSNLTLYGMYQKSVVLSYDGNDATSGSIASQRKYAYYNSNGQVTYPSFTLASNGFSKTGYSWTAWAKDSVNGTQYMNGANITLQNSTVFYACWIISANPYYATFADTSIWTQVDNTDNKTTPFSVSSDKSYISVSAQDNEQMHDSGRAAYRAIFESKGCNKVRVKVNKDSGGRNSGSGSIIVNGILQNISAEGVYEYLYFDIDSDIFYIQIGVSNASSYFSVSTRLYEIYVYYE